MPLAASAATNGTLASCRAFAELSESVFLRRNQGVPAATQKADWEKVIAGKKDAASQRVLMGNILTYAYSPKARGISPKQAKTQYFQDCRASVEVSKP